jgi:hypothetical protein
LRCRIGRTTPSVTGFRNLLECQLVASGPVSASPSPDDAGDDQAGIVEGGPIRVREGVAELAALVHRAGGLRRHVAGNAAGKENWVKRRFMPSSSSEMFG